MNKIIFFLYFFICAGSLFAQQVTIIHVRDAKTGTALANASVKIKSTKKIGN